jgi:hypothetical protein
VDWFAASTSSSGCSVTRGSSAADRAGYQSELSEASKLLDYSEQFVPRN